MKLQLLAKALKQALQAIVLTVFVYTLSTISASAATLDIAKPLTNQRVAGVIEVRWSIFNSGMENVPYDLSFRDYTCTSGFSVQGANFTQTVKNGHYTSSIDTRSVSDGQKCIRLCAVDTADCIYKLVNVVNQSNQAPIITNFPDQLEFTAFPQDGNSEVFRHNVEYFDPDNDVSYLMLLQAPRFLVLEQNGLNTIGEYFLPGEYFVSFMAIDELGAASQQSFNIVVRDGSEVIPTPIPTGTPVPTGTITPTATPTPEITPEAGELGFNIVSPTSESVFDGLENEISWELNEGDENQFGKLVIEYANSGKSDSEDFTEIVVIDDYQMREFKWDVTDFEPGEYFLKVSLFNDDDQILQETRSGLFKVEETSGQDSLKVDGFSPPNKSEIENLRPEISAKFTPSEGAKIVIEEVEIRLDNKKITEDCSLDEEGFVCHLDKDLDVEEHKVKVSIKDSLDQSIEQEWVFLIVSPEQENVPDEEEKAGFDFLGFFEDFNLEGDQMKLLYLCCGILLIVGLFVFVIRTLGKKKAYDNQVTDFNSTNEFSSTPPAFDESTLEDEPYDFSVGQHDVVGDLETPAVSSADSIPQIETSSSTEIPEWLQGDESSGANPIDSSGTPIDMKGQDAENTIGDQSKVHESFDLAKASYGDE